MTEQECIKYLEQHGYIADDVKDMCIKALEEVEQYKKEMWALNQICRDYTSLGTVKELKEVKEKQIAKKPVKRSFIVPYEGINVCPSCKEPLPSRKEHHCKCGQKLDWGNEDAE